ncbi:FeoA family protein [Gephyromycinifex aptenodytis]|uniref:FeoA family protein n=1 Tax=Gephyromycinifex aptenodytis TaxID=2716227 RepID=UPI001D01E8C3|nr:FeoA family protein [Gephyromycinifex aptenodytis]
MPTPAAGLERERRWWRRPGAAAGSLAALHVGQSATLLGFRDSMSTETTRRLFDLGFTPGAHIELLRRAPMGDPFIFRVADTEIALRRRQAESICVAIDS